MSSPPFLALLRRNMRCEVAYGLPKCLSLLSIEIFHFGYGIPHPDYPVRSAFGHEALLLRD